MRRNFPLLGSTILSGGLLAASLASAATVVTLEAPGAQSVDTASFGAVNPLVETFDGFATETFSSPTGSAVGVYDQAQIFAGNRFGGANGSQFMTSFSVGTTLTLASTAKYFGFWWSAGSVGNQVDLVSGGTTIFSLGTQDIVDFVSGPGGSPLYFGDPNGGGNNSQPYVFVNIFADQAFDSVVFSGANFESDNHTLAQDYTQITGTPISAVPLPASLPLLAGAVGLGAVARRFRKKS